MGTPLLMSIVLCCLVIPTCNNNKIHRVEDVVLLKIQCLVNLDSKKLLTKIVNLCRSILTPCGRTCNNI